MKQKYNFQITSLLALLVCLYLPACTSGEEEIGEGRPLEVMAEISSTFTTRADDPHKVDYDKSKFADGDLIKISKKGDGSTSANYKYSVASSYWQLADGQTPLTTTGDETFEAVFPSDFSEILADQTTYTNFWKSNKLVSEKQATGNLVNFQFAPAFAKVTIIVEYTSTPNQYTPKSSVMGNDIISASGGSQTIQLLYLGNVGNKYTYTGIINTTTTTITISAPILNGNSGSFTDINRAFESAKNYTYNFTSNNNLILNGVTVKDFEPATGNDSGSGNDWSAT